jgi:GNAT superfamily N-acetyltransferase
VIAVAIRPAEPGDVPTVAALRAEAWETPEYWAGRVANYLAGTISTRQAMQDRAMFVAEVEGAVVGFAAGHRTTRHGCQGELQWINVAQARQRLGVAGKLLVTMAAWFVERSAMRVCVDVEPKNTTARAFYAKYGAVDLRPSWMVWEDIRAVADRKAG